MERKEKSVKDGQSLFINPHINNLQTLKAAEPLQTGGLRTDYTEYTDYSEVIKINQPADPPPTIGPPHLSGGREGGGAGQTTLIT